MIGKFIKNTGLYLAIAAAILVVGGSLLILRPHSDSPTPQGSSGAPLPITSDGHGECRLIASDELTAYARPSENAQIFGVIARNETVLVTGITEDGWIGFDPMSAQAPNVGPFRSRWIKNGMPFAFSGACAELPPLAKIPPDTCFVMAQTDTPIYAKTSTSSEVVSTMHFGDYLEAIAKKEASWISVDSKDGSLQGEFAGWVPLSSIDFNGYTCGDLPAA